MPVVKDVSKRSMVIYILQSEDRKSELASAKWMVANSNIIAQIEEKENLIASPILLHLILAPDNITFMISLIIYT